MIDTTSLGVTTARAMEYLDTSDEFDGGTVKAVMVAVVVADKNNETSYTRTFSSEEMYYGQIGLALAAMECVRDGFRFTKKADDDEEDDE